MKWTGLIGTVMTQLTVSIKNAAATCYQVTRYDGDLYQSGGHGTRTRRFPSLMIRQIRT